MLGRLKKLNKPWLIQDYLEKIPINFEKKGETLMSPLCVLRENKAHCFEGALLAAAALMINGEKPSIMDLATTDDDESHVIALFKYNNRWGAISKTNHAVLRYRDPVYKNLRELTMSYYHEYFLNSNGAKTLRSYSRPLDLSKFRGWVDSEEDLWYMDEALDKQKHYSLFDSKTEKVLRVADSVEIKAGKVVQYVKK